MKIHWHWGTKLVLFLGLFMLLMIGLVYMSFQQTFDLVEKDYYPKSLDYQVEIDKKINANQLGELIKVEKQGDDLWLSFPAILKPESVSGELFFYRPSDKKDDHLIPVELDSIGKQYISLSPFVRGKYTLKMNYQADSISYLQEETIFVKMD